ncbi:hypothetical protein [Empedobacter tilapiae]|uniref:Uncharacterized protein n=1 Tax=Empedobacter tilapiae TaxID=2491114 RepID=A0A4Z1C366_9FLAO|nr:hypothetical protein [Empedobacter tilapiae]TGN30235.1 hypothetical protein E4J94_01320 [Empedobacter tilapiae]
MKILKITIIIFLTFQTYMFSQNKNNNLSSDKKFLLNLITDDVIKFVDEKNEDVFKFNYLNLVDIKFDSIGAFPPLYNISLYKFNTKKNKISISSNDIKIVYNSSSCDDYFIAVDEFNKIYRLKGFSSNDFLFMLNDIQKNTYKRYKIIDIIKSFEELTNEIEFKCIYKSLINFDLNQDCLKSCSVGKPSHLSR